MFAQSVEFSQAMVIFHMNDARGTIIQPMIKILIHAEAFLWIFCRPAQII